MSWLGAVRFDGWKDVNFFGINDCSAAGIGCWVGVIPRICASDLGGEWSRGWWVHLVRWYSTGGKISTSFGFLIEKRSERGFINRRGWCPGLGGDGLIDCRGYRCWSWWGIADWCRDKGGCRVCRLRRLCARRWQSRLERLVWPAVPLLDTSSASTPSRRCNTPAVEVQLLRYAEADRGSPCLNIRRK